MDFDDIEEVKIPPPSSRRGPSTPKPLGSLSLPLSSLNAKKTSYLSKSRRSHRSHKISRLRNRTSLLSSIKMSNPRDEINYLEHNFQHPINVPANTNGNSLSFVLRVANILCTVGANPFWTALTSFNWFMPISASYKLTYSVDSYHAADLDQSPCQLWWSQSDGQNVQSPASVDCAVYDSCNLNSGRSLRIKQKQFGNLNGYATVQNWVDATDFGYLHCVLPHVSGSPVILHDGQVLMKFKLYAWGLK